MYATGTEYDPDDGTKGLFRGFLLVRVSYYSYPLMCSACGQSVAAGTSLSGAQTIGPGDVDISHLPSLSCYKS
jgi:hypothetical protein